MNNSVLCVYDLDSNNGTNWFSDIVICFCWSRFEIILMRWKFEIQCLKFVSKDTPSKYESRFQPSKSNMVCPNFNFEIQCLKCV